ncbi:MAG: hypothetical protein HYV26_04225 [Candidatus Hydrogenedentes bacterium]|nr:hypothetical protein [Candidatus Hydrogenedentota bacterium]
MAQTDSLKYHPLDSLATHAPDALADAVHDAPVVEAFWTLRLGFGLLAIVAGADKFVHVFGNWEIYLAPDLAETFGGNSHGIMMIVGVLEIVTGLGLFLLPRVFGFVLTAWLVAIVINMMSHGEYYDIGLGAAGLACGAFALGRMAQDHHRRGGD